MENGNEIRLGSTDVGEEDLDVHSGGEEVGDLK
jgi:hypothetical protein